MQQTLPHGGGLPARKKRRFGCLGAIIFSLAFGAVVYLVVIAVIAPWGYFLGGHFHLLPGWQGLGRLHSATAGDYAAAAGFMATPEFLVLPCSALRTVNNFRCVLAEVCPKAGW
jgi:hypothetical protein